MGLVTRKSDLGACKNYWQRPAFAFWKVEYQLLLHAQFQYSSLLSVARPVGLSITLLPKIAHDKPNIIDKYESRRVNSNNVAFRYE